MMLTGFVKDETSVENNYLNEHIILSKGDSQIKFNSDLTGKRIGDENHFIFSNFGFCLLCSVSHALKFLC